MLRGACNQGALCLNREERQEDKEVTSVVQLKSAFTLLAYKIAIYELNTSDLQKMMGSINKGIGTFLAVFYHRKRKERGMDILSKSGELGKTQTSHPKEITVFGKVLGVRHCSGVNWTNVSPGNLERPVYIWKQILHRWSEKWEVSSDHLILIKQLSILWIWKRKGKQN